MTPLALNMHVYKQIKPKYSLLISILPLGLCFVGIGMASFLTDRMLLNAYVEFFVFLGLVFVFTAPGYFIGWRLDVLIARLGFGWSAAKCHQVFQCSQFPDHWLKEGAPSLAQAEQKAFGEWSEMRKMGVIRYILKYGILWYALPLYVVIVPATVVIKDVEIGLRTLGFPALMCGVVGTLVGWGGWYFLERQYQRFLKAKADD